MSVFGSARKRDQEGEVGGRDWERKRLVQIICPPTQSSSALLSNSRWGGIGCLCGALSSLFLFFVLFKWITRARIADIVVGGQKKGRCLRWAAIQIGCKKGKVFVLWLGTASEWLLCCTRSFCLLETTFLSLWEFRLDSGLWCLEGLTKILYRSPHSNPTPSLMTSIARSLARPRQPREGLFHPP